MFFLNIHICRYQTELSSPYQHFLTPYFPPNFHSLSFSTATKNRKLGIYFFSFLRLTIFLLFFFFLPSLCFCRVFIRMDLNKLEQKPELTHPSRDFIPHLFNPPNIGYLYGMYLLRMIDIKFELDRFFETFFYHRRCSES